MAFSTYTELKASVADWLNRTDLTDAIVDFIDLAEAELTRRVRRQTRTSTIYAAAATATPPSDMASPIAMWLSTDEVYRDVPLTICTPEMLRTRLARANGTTGRPTHVAYFDNDFWFAPIPDTSYDVIVLYNMQLTKLSTSPSLSNDILEHAPDAYLFGALLQASPYLEHDERIAVWQMKFDNAIEQLNHLRDEEAYGAGPKDASLPIVFG